MATEKKETKKTTAKKASTKKAPAKKTKAVKKDSSLFAVIETGGKQYRIQEGDTISVEKLDDTKVGDKITFDSVLLIDDGAKTTLGTPIIKGKKVTAEIKEEGKGKKIHVVRFKSKSRYYKKTGHRQPYMKAEIVKIG